MDSGEGFGAGSGQIKQILHPKLHKARQMASFMSSFLTGYGGQQTFLYRNFGVLASESPSLWLTGARLSKLHFGQESPPFLLRTQPTPRGHRGPFRNIGGPIQTSVIYMCIHICIYTCPTTLTLRASRRKKGKSAKRAFPWPSYARTSALP